MFKISTEMLGVLVPIGTILMLVSIGAFSVIIENFFRKREEKWILEEAVIVEDANRTTQLIDKIPSFSTTIPKRIVKLEKQDKNNLITYEETVNCGELVDFSHSEITEEVINNLNIIADNVQREMNYYAMNCKELKQGNEDKTE